MVRLVADEKIRRFTERGWWGERTLDDLFKETVALHPETVAVTDPPDRTEVTGGEAQKLSYRELDRLTDRLAAFFQARGIGSGSIVGVQLPNVVELAAIYLAASRTGAVLTPMPVQYREYELSQLLDFIEPVAFITAGRIGDHRHADMVVKLADSFPALHTVGGFGEDLPSGVVPLDDLPDGAPASVTVDANDTLTICWTSGTEGRPKGVPRSHNEWIVPAYATVDSARLMQGDHLLNPFPMVNMAGIGGMLVPWLLTGGKLVMHHPLNLPAFLQQIAVEQVHYTVAPPALLTLLLKNEALLSQADFSSIRTIGSGSAPLSPWMVREWQDRFGITVTNFFGSNEGATFVSGPDAIPDPEQRAAFFPRFGVTGFDWPDRVAQMMESRLVDPATGEVIEAVGVPGEMHIRGAAVFSGYYQDPARTAAAFDQDGFYRTGDLFEIAADDEGPRFYRFVGRAGDVINRGGMKIVAEELELLLAGHPDLAETAVIGYPDEVLSEKVAVVVAPRPEAEPTLKEVRRFLAEQGVATFKLPERILLVPALPRNPVGKVDRKALREQLA